MDELTYQLLMAIARAKGGPVDLERLANDLDRLGHDEAGHAVRCAAIEAEAPTEAEQRRATIRALPGGKPRALLT